MLTEVEERDGLVKSRLRWSIRMDRTKEGQRDHLQGPGYRLRLPFASADDLVNMIQKVNLLEKRKLWFIFDCDSKLPFFAEFGNI